MNNDGYIDILDIVIIVDLILDDLYNPIGDVNEDLGLNIQDIILIINLIL